MTSIGMSWHASNGRGSTVSMTGHLMLVETSLMGAEVERRSTPSVPSLPVGLVCHTTITAATSAHIADSRRSLAAIKSPGRLRGGAARIGWPLRGVYKSRTDDRTGNENMF